MNKMKSVPALCAGFLMSATMAFASTEMLQNPPPSEFVDAESSVNVPIPTDEGRHIKLTLAFEPTPSNAVQVAFGRDLNGSETLEPEETEMIVGCDCGSPVVRDEVKGRGEGEQRNVQVSFEEQGEDNHCSPSPLIFTLKQSRIVSDRWTSPR